VAVLAVYAEFNGIYDLDQFLSEEYSFEVFIAKSTVAFFHSFSLSLFQDQSFPLPLSVPRVRKKSSRL